MEITREPEAFDLINRTFTGSFTFTRSDSMGGRHPISGSMSFTFEEITYKYEARINESAPSTTEPSGVVFGDSGSFRVSQSKIELHDHALDDADAKTAGVPSLYLSGWFSISAHRYMGGGRPLRDLTIARESAAGSWKFELSPE